MRILKKIKFAGRPQIKRLQPIRNFIQKPIKNQKMMERELKITAPEGCEIEKVEIVDGVAIVTFKEKERKLPKSWEEFCEMFPVKNGECYIENHGGIISARVGKRSKLKDRNVFPDRATAEAVLALFQLIQLRDCYNGDWTPDWENCLEEKYQIYYYDGKLTADLFSSSTFSPLYFNDEELAKEFLHYFCDLIEKLKPLYGIKEGGEG